jgi:ABC-type phosphate/phosphonate transport system permease subunit
MGKAERTMLILVAIVFLATVFAVLVAPHVPFLAAGE